MGPTFDMGPPGAIEPPGAMEAHQAPVKPPRKYQMFEMSPTSDEMRVSNVPAPSLQLLNCSSQKPSQEWVEEEDRVRQGQIDKLAEELRQTSLKNVNSRKLVSTHSKTRLDEFKEASPAKASPGPPAKQRSRQPSGVAGKWKITSITVEESKANQVEQNFQQTSSSQSSSMQVVEQHAQQQSYSQQQHQQTMRHQQQFSQQEVHQVQQNFQHEQQRYQQGHVEQQSHYQNQLEEQQLQLQQQQQIQMQQQQLQQQRMEQQQRFEQQQAYQHQQQFQQHQQQNQVCHQGSRRSSLLPCLPTPWGPQQGGEEQVPRQSSLIHQLSSQYGVERSSSSECNRSSRRSSIAAEPLPLQTPWGAFPAPAPREPAAQSQSLPAPWHNQGSRQHEEMDQNPTAYLANCPKPNPVYPSGGQPQHLHRSRRSSVSGVAATSNGTARHSRSSSIDPFGRPIFSFLRDDQQGPEHRSRGLESRRSSVVGTQSLAQDMLHSQDMNELKVRNAPILLAQPKNVSDPGQSQLSRDGSLYQSTEALNGGSYGAGTQGSGRSRHRSGSQAPRERRRSTSQGPTYNWLEHGGLVGTGLRVGSEVREPEPKDGLALSRDGGFFMPFGNSENVTKKCKTKRQLKAEEEARQRAEEEENRRSLEERAARKEQRREKRARHRTQSVSSAPQPLGGGHNKDCTIERCTTNCKVAMTRLGHNYDCTEERCSRNCKVNLRRKGHKTECTEDVCMEDCPIHLRRLGHNHDCTLDVCTRNCLVKLKREGHSLDCTEDTCSRSCQVPIYHYYIRPI